MSDYDIGKAFEKIENELISSMIRNLDRHRAEEKELGIEWSQWQVEQLKALEVYKRKNSKKFTEQYNSINQHIRRVLQDSYNDGSTQQERQILQAIKRGFKGKGKNNPAFTGVTETAGEFFKTNERKLNSLIKATAHDMEKAEIAVLRMANDRYRKIIFNAQVMANSGAGTYAKAVDMAAKDFLSAGINCIQYRNGRRVNIKSYAEMALRTANKRAYLQGEGAKRQEWGIYTVILNKRGNPCPLCAPFVGRVFIDDVWSGGPKDGISPVTGIKYPLLSEAVKKGLYHPNCRDAHTTYFEGISTPPENSRYTADELDELAEKYKIRQQQNYAQNEAERMERMSKFSLDKDNQRAYGARAEQWRDKIEKLESPIENPDESGIIKNKEMLRSKSRVRDDIKPISEKRFNELTIEARKNGAVILRGGEEIEEHLDKVNASASIIGDTLLFREHISVSEVLEETYHFMQNKNGMNDDKGEPLRTILNEIDAKRYLIKNAKRFNVPRRETEETEAHLKKYLTELENYKRRFGNYE